MVCWTLNFLSRKMLYFYFWGPSRGKEVITVNGPSFPKCHKLQTHSFVILTTYSLSQISLDNNWRLTECLFKSITRIYIEIYNLKLLKEDWNVYLKEKKNWNDESDVVYIFCFSFQMQYSVYLCSLTGRQLEWFDSEW